MATLITATALLFGSTSFADTFQFRVAFEDVPGIEDIESGNIQAGIKVLRYQLNQTDAQHSGALLATLCAAYIVNGSLQLATHTCDKAIEIAPTETAYNNRGVCRALSGNLAGAREDFERIRPVHLEAYMEELKTRDVPLIAIDNARLIERISAQHSTAEIDASVAMRASLIQNPID